MNTSELIDLALDLAVAQTFKPGSYWESQEFLSTFHPSTDWAQAGPIIEREGITISKEDDGWSAYFRNNLFNEDGSEYWQIGSTPLIAAMRCYVASKLGDTVEIPEELV